MLLDKTQLPIVAMEFMNEVHLKDIDIVNELFEEILKYESNPTDENEKSLTLKFKLWIDHTIDHFSGEEKMMIEKNFFAYPRHKGEHDRVLNNIKELFENWEKTKDVFELKLYFIEVLPSWFVNHIQTMDTVTANFLKNN